MRKIYLNLSCILVSMLMAGYLSAQVSAYSFAQSTGTYTPITGGTVLYSGNFDDGTTSQTLPFAFNYNSVNYSQVWVSANGHLVFGASDPTNGVWSSANVISGALVTTGALAPWAGDLSGWAGTLGGQTAEVRAEVIGSAPNRIFVAQWRCRPAYATSTTNAAFISFQARLVEGTNQVQFVYGPSAQLVGTTNIATARQVGLRGASNADFNNRTNTTSVSINSSTAGSLNSSTQAWSSINATPGRYTDGLTYTWTPPSCIAPGGLTATNITASSADLSWNTFADATGYNVEFRIVGAPSWTSFTGNPVSGTSISLTGLSSANYEWRVQSICDGPVSGFATSTFSTIPGRSCGFPLAVTPGTYTYPLLNATNAGPASNVCGTGASLAYWYSFTPAEDGFMTVKACGGVDTRLSIFTGSCPSLSCFAFNDDDEDTNCQAFGFASSVNEVAVVGGTTYYIHWDNRWSTTSSSWTLSFSTTPSCTPIPANQACASAAVLAVQLDPANSTAGFNSCASVAIQNPSCVSSFSSFNDVWYEFVATDANHDLRLTFASPASLGIALYTGACGTADLGCIPPGSLLSGEDILISGLTVGQTYRIQVLSTAAGVGNFDIVVWENPCPFPTALTATSPTSNSVTLNWTENGTATTWDLYFGPTPLAAPTGATTPTLAGISPNNPYLLTGLASSTAHQVYVRASCGSLWFGPVSFTTLAPPPVNDNCDNAITLTVNSDFNCGAVTAGTTAGATASPQATTGLSGTANNDVWYRFTATGTNHRISLINLVNIGGGTSSSTDMGMGLYNASGGCLGLTFFGTSDPETWDVTGLTPGTVYFVRVYGWFSSIQNVNFNICVGTPPPPPTNNLCANALMVGPRSTTPGTNVNANNVGAGGTCGTAPGSSGVWYTVIGTGGPMSATTCGSVGSFDTKINVYTGSCGAFTCVGGNDDATGCGTLSRVNFNSVQGQLYYIYVTGFGTATGNFTLTMEAACATTATLPAPSYRQYCNPQTELLGVQLNGYVETYQWLQNSNPISGATSPQLLLNRWSLGNYRASVTCDANTLTTNSVAVNRVIVRDESGANADWTKVCNTTPATFSVPSVPGYTYLWRRRGDNAVVSTTNEFTVQGSEITPHRTYDVFMTSPTGCTYSTKLVLLSGGTCSTVGGKPEGQEMSGKTGMEAVSGDVVLNFYPNPVSQVYKITLNGLAQDEMFTVSWFDLTGKEVSRATQISTGTGTQAELSVNTLASGMYMVQVNNANHNFTFKVMVQK